MLLWFLLNMEIINRQREGAELGGPRSSPFVRFETLGTLKRAVNHREAVCNQGLVPVEWRFFSSRCSSGKLFHIF